MEPHSAEWHEKQAAQYKAELDQLNPRLNVAEARIRELEGENARLQKQLSIAHRELVAANKLSERLAKERNNATDCKSEDA